MSISCNLQQQSFKEDGKNALEAFHQWIQDGAGGADGWVLEEENHEGWRVSVDEGEGKQGWLLLRASLHDPLLVLNVESDIPKGMLHADLVSPSCRLSVILKYDKM